VPPDGNTILTFPDGLGTANVFSDMDRIWIDYSSSIHSGEVNLVCCTGCCSHGDGKSGYDPKQAAQLRPVLPDVRVVRRLPLPEPVRTAAHRRPARSGDRRAASEVGKRFLRHQHPEQSLYGPQIGARVRRWNDRLGWEATGKLGAFYNDARQRQRIVDFPDFESAASGKRVRRTVRLHGRIGNRRPVPLNEVWNLRAGYNVIYIGGVALAPDQLDFSGDFDGGNRLDRTGGVFLHGVSLGIEARW
jgi:hypothetical protein